MPSDKTNATIPILLTTDELFVNTCFGRLARISAEQPLLLWCWNTVVASETLEELSGELQERVAGISTAKSFARYADEARRFHQRTTELYDLTIESVKLSSLIAAGRSWLPRLRFSFGNAVVVDPRGEASAMRLTGASVTGRPSDNQRSHPPFTVFSLRCL